jgi:hypothetical protein
MLNSYMKDNVIQFPSNGYAPSVVPQSDEERKANIAAYQTKFILDHSIELAYLLFDDMVARGMDLSVAENVDRDMLMVCETIKATMMRACGLDHPIHKLTEDLVNSSEGAAFQAAFLQSGDDELT